MRKINILLFIILILSTASARADVSSGLLAWWPFNDNASFAYDASGNGYNIWIDNPTWTSGKVGEYALSLDGTNADLNTSTSINYNSTTQVTVSIWLNHSFITGASTTLFESGIYGASNAYTFRLEDNSGTCKNALGLYANTVTCYAWPSTTSGWHHYVAVFNNAGSNTLYIDGVLQTATLSQSAGGVKSTFFNRPFYLMNGLAGQINDVRVYDRALSSSDISTLYDLGAEPPSVADAPVVALTSPASGATVSGRTVTLTATATGTDAITAVQFQLNGNNIGSQITASPYSMVWDSTTVTNGNYVLVAQAFNSAGQVTTATIPITVANSVVPAPASSTSWPVVENVLSYGAKADAVQVTADTTANSTTITIDSGIHSNYSLSNADVGKVVEIFQVGKQATSTVNMDLLTTIVSVTDSSHAVLATAATVGKTAAKCIIGSQNAAAFQAAVNAVGSSPTIIYIPAGNYLLVPPVMLTAGFQFSGVFSNYPSVTVSKPNIEFLGENQNRTILLGEGAEEFWGQYPGRGTMFWAQGPVAGTVTKSGTMSGTVAGTQLIFANLTMDGAVSQGKRAVEGSPANATTGDGWDTSHDAVLDTGSALYADQQFLNVTFTHWRGEILKSVTSGLNGTIEVENDSFIDGNADSFNFSFTHTVANNIFDNVNQPIEFWLGAVCPENGVWTGCEGNSVWENNIMTNITHGFALTGADTRDGTPPSGSSGQEYYFTADNNVFDCPNGIAIYFAPATWLHIFNNRFISGQEGIVSNGAGYQSIPPYGETNHDILVENNYFENVPLPTDFSNSPGEDASDLDILHNIARGSSYEWAASYGDGLLNDLFSFNYSEGAGIDDWNLNSNHQWFYDDGTNDFAIPGPYFAPYVPTMTISYSAGQKQTISTSGTYMLDNTKPSFNPADVIDYLNPDNPPGYGTMNILFSTSGTASSLLYLSSFILSQPVSQTVVTGQSATFTVSASWNPTYQWQQSTDSGSTWTNISGATQASYTAASSTASGTEFRCVVTSTTPSMTVNSNAVTLTVQSPVTPSTSSLAILTQPVFRTVIVGQTATFTATANESSASYQWQQSTDNGVTWTNISTATSASYTTPVTALGNSGTVYQCVITDSASNSVTSHSAALGVVAQASTTPVTVPKNDEVLVSWNGSQWNLTAGPEIPPTVSLTSPSNGASLATGSEITLTATATDTNTGGSVAKVDFYLNTHLVGTVTTSPYTFNFSNVTPTSFVEADGSTIENSNSGQYLITARVTDNTGLTTFSSPVWITVNPLISYPLNVAISGNGYGNVTGTNIHCGINYNLCSASVVTGTSVTLTATPSNGEVFAGWSGGGCSGTAITCTVTMNQAQTVTATFNTSTSSLNPGCVSGDSSPTIYDAELTAEASVNMITLTSAQLQAAEVDGTGKLDIYDAFLIAEYAVSLITTFPVQS